jgi:1-aminocyclopropane-1-carboxylate deaminase/D-cysteine desulfhydrase-like pyridoxal-dependent ACC family enzyme
MLAFGTYPTPVLYLEQLSTAKASLWVKRDDLTSPVYGGSKLRKLGPLLSDAKQRGATQLVTVGALGSHHVLATGVFGKVVGLSLEALVLPRPASRHVLETARASIGQGVRLTPAASYTEAAQKLALRAAAGAYSIPAGGSNLLGTRGLLAAGAELSAQVRAGLLPEPDLIVLALGSGGTAAGLAAGVLQAGLKTRVLAIAVAEPVKVFEHQAHALARALTPHASRAELAPRRGSPSAQARLEVNRGYLGDGYGHATRASEQATREAARVGLMLDETYTGKAFAAALDRIALGNERQILFWHTLSSAQIGPLLTLAPEEHELPSELRRLAY